MAVLRQIHEALVGHNFYGLRLFLGRGHLFMLKKQFKELKKGDRFYYENGPSQTSFTLHADAIILDFGSTATANIS